MLAKTDLDQVEKIPPQQVSRQVHRGEPDLELKRAKSWMLEGHRGKKPGDTDANGAAIGN